MVSAKGAQKLNHLSPVGGNVLSVPTPSINNMSPGKMQHIFDTIDRKSGKNLEKMQNDLTKIYMMQVKEEKPEIKKRHDGEWGTLPSNVIGNQQNTPLGQHYQITGNVSKDTSANTNDMKQLKMKMNLIRRNNQPTTQHNYASMQP
jgi:hypothetical protein